MEEHCLTLCNYDIDFRAISPEVVGVCTRNLHAILQCAVGKSNCTFVNCIPLVTAEMVTE